MAQINIYWSEFKKEILSISSIEKINNDLAESFKLDLKNSKKPQQLSFFSKMLLNDILERDFEMVNALNSFRKDEHGKPSIQENLHFNISHSNDLVVIAICKHAMIGIDVQQEKAFSARILPKVFCENEHQAFQETEDQSAFFFDIWSKKEASVKATGKGIKTGLNSFSVLDSIVPLDNHQLHLQSINIKKGFSAAVALSHPISNIVIKKID